MATVQATAPVTSASNGSNAAGLLSIGKVADATGLCIATLRRLDGKLPSYVLPSGHRRYRLVEVLAVLSRNGLVEQERLDEGGTDSVPICLVTRVSTPKDSQRTSLVNQKERLAAYVAEQFGNLKTRLFWSERVASGLNFSHPKLVELFELVLSGKLDNGYILACFKDRILRFGNEVVELLCRQHNIEVRYIDQLDAKTESSELTEDLLSVLTHYTAKASGQKTRKLYGVQVDDEAASLIFNLRSQKLPLRQIADRLKAEGKHLDCNGREITFTVLHKFLKRHGSIGRKLVRMKAGADSSAVPAGADSLTAFIAERVQREEVNPTTGKPIFTRFKVLYAAYDAYCDQHGLIAQSRNATGNLLRGAGFRVRNHKGYLGLYAAIRPNP